MTIYYFSATGNSLKMAQDIASMIENTTIQRIGLERIDAHPKSNKVGFVFPVYMGGIPNIVNEFLMDFPYQEDVYYYAVCTYYTYKGCTISSVNNILRNKGVRLNYGTYLSTVGNCLMEYEVSESRRAKKITAARSKSEIIVANIMNEVDNHISKHCRKLEKLHQYLFHHFFSDAYKKFTLENNCIGCGICEKLCPVENISIDKDKPQWGKKCIACHACVHWCPQNAINIGKSKGRLQYQNPDIKISMLLNS